MKLHPPSTLLIGPGGTGKTTSCASLLAAGKTVLMIATEPTAPNRVLEACRERGISDKLFHWQHISPAPPAWASLIESAQLVNTLTIKDLADLKGGIAKQDGKQWIALLKALQNFVSDRDGTVFGDCTGWDHSVALVIDGLSGVNEMSRNLTVGLKPNPAPGEWGVMQGNILNLIRKLCADCSCYFVVIAHVERENNELTGVSNITVSTLGAKLAPKIPPLFTNVVYAKRNLAVFQWSTMEPGVDTKSGDLPLSAQLAPSFEPIIKSYNARLASVAPTVLGVIPAIAVKSA